MRLFGVVAIAALVGASAAGQDAVEIKMATPKAGDRFKVVKTEKTKTVSAFEVGGMKESKAEDETRDIVHTDEVVTPGDKSDKPIKLIRTYEKYDVKGGKEKGEPPLKAAITIAKADGKYTFAVGGKPLTGDFAAVLDKEFNKKDDEPTTRDMLPGKPVKPGETWKIDPAKFVKSLEEIATVDAEKAKMTGKLVKTYTKGGKQFGTLELQFDFPIKKLAGDAPALKTGAMKMTTLMDLCIDGTVPGEQTKANISFGVQIEAMGVTADIKAEGVLTDTRELLPKK